jgi:hypothetical protein
VLAVLVEPLVVVAQKTLAVAVAVLDRQTVLVFLNKAAVTAEKVSLYFVFQIQLAKPQLQVVLQLPLLVDI